MAQAEGLAMDKNSYNLPHQTVDILQSFQPDVACQNMGLLLDKLFPRSVFEQPGREKNPNAGKAPWLLDILKPKNGGQAQNNHIDSEFARNVYKRWVAVVQSLGTKPFNLEVDWRMIVGLGGETVLETDLTLHHHYGIPVIPGSALKGLTRAYVALEKKEYFVPGASQSEEKLQASRSTDTDHPEIKRIFGEQEKAGTVCFFDAIPLNGQAEYVLDIMNPHYPDYYRSLQSSHIEKPSNDQQPNPVTFLTVTNTTFSFALAPRNPDDAGDVEKVKEWLQEALGNYGVGGKTSAGYGYFKVGQAHTRPENLPQFQEGQTVKGIVLDEKVDRVAARYVGSGRASKCLQYLPFPTNQVIILIDPAYEEAKQWKTRNTSICQFIQERVEENRILLICKPGEKSK
jgi:CRISPR-associated protein Cmr6